MTKPLRYFLSACLSGFIAACIGSLKIATNNHAFDPLVAYFILLAVLLLVEAVVEVSDDQAG